tara:strand:+ start:204 stop:572 length:369 start_codon:yes stop_codon:yes gene_type:complete
MKIRKNKTTYLSKFLFLKNPNMPNGKKTKNIGKIAKAADFRKVDMASLTCIKVDPDEYVCAAAIEWLKTPSVPIVSILTKSMGNKTRIKIEIAIKYLGMFFLYVPSLRRKKADNGTINTIPS